MLFTDNETNGERLFGVPNATPYVKDAFHEFVVHGRRDAVNPARTGTKAAPRYVRRDRRRRDGDHPAAARSTGQISSIRSAPNSTRLFAQRQHEADAFYQRVTPFEMPEDMRRVQRQAFAGMLWTKQYYRYMVHRWLEGDPAGPPPPAERQQGRNHEW